MGLQKLIIQSVTIFSQFFILLEPVTGNVRGSGSQLWSKAHYNNALNNKETNWSYATIIA